MDGSCKTILNLIRNDQDLFLGARVLFLNAQSFDGFDILHGLDLVCQQPFQSFAQALEKHGYSVCNDTDIFSKPFDVALVLMPKNMIEARFIVAQAARALKKGGVLLCAADNKSGGGRIMKMMENFGFSDVTSIAGNKARGVRGCVDVLCEEALSSALYDGREQYVCDGQFLSQPGVFGWNKLDVGSVILTEYLSPDLKGRGADFGCGYGYLSDFLLSSRSAVQSLYCIDADWRAVTVCQKNLARYSSLPHYIWGDLTCVPDELSDLDFIVMNPPFHEGKTQDVGIGVSFIKTAYSSLKKGGELWMVANAHLPYENVLTSCFPSVNKLYEGKGFKVFKAVK